MENKEIPYYLFILGIVSSVSWLVISLIYQYSWMMKMGLVFILVLVVNYVLIYKCQNKRLFSILNTITLILLALTYYYYSLLCVN